MTRRTRKAFRGLQEENEEVKQGSRYDCVERRKNKQDRDQKRWRNHLLGELMRDYWEKAAMSGKNKKNSSNGGQLKKESGTQWMRRVWAFRSAAATEAGVWGPK